MPPFRSSYDQLGLLTAIAAIARQVSPGDPFALTRYSYDAAAEGSEEFPGLPKSGSVKRRFPAREWREIVAIALGAQGQLNHVVGGLASDEGADGLTREEVVEALRVVAHRTGRRSLTRDQYSRERDRIRRSSTRRHHPQLFLPSANQIEVLFGDWEAALRAAELEPRASPGAERTGAEWIDVLDWALEVHGCLLAQNELYDVARAEGFQLAARRIPLAEVVAELRRRRTARGLATPEKPPPLSERPDYSRPSGRKLPEALRTAPRRRNRWSEEECVEAFVRFLDQHASSGNPGQQAYRLWAGQNHAPYPAAFARFGGLTEIRAKAIERRRERGGGTDARRGTSS